MLSGHLALTIAALFTGAAFYVNFAEQPARLGLKDRPLLVEWKAAYKRGFAMQASLAMAGFVLGAIAWWQTGKPAFLIGALLMLAPWPWTLFVIMPTNKVLMATNPAKAGAETRDLIVKWDRLHLVRTALGALATLAFVLAVSR
jgi:anthrone oxygenase-like protein